MTRPMDLTGMKFGKLSVISRSENKKGKIAWNCLCACGHTAIISSSALKSGGNISCGCEGRKHLIKGGPLIFNLTGQKFGELLVTSRAENKSGMVMWNCDCGCGCKAVVSRKALKEGSTISCGCERRKRLFKGQPLVFDIAGQKFGRLTVLHKAKNSQSVKWLCACNCGETIEVASYSLRKGYTKSCGCIVKNMDKTLAAKRTLYKTYERGAKRRKILFELTFDEFINLTQQNCHYCNKAPSQHFKINYEREAFLYNGIDRLNSAGNYTIDNSVCCCKDCNHLKWDRDEPEFISWVERCYTKLKLWEI